MTDNERETYLSKEEAAALIKRAKAGDNDAWERLYKNYEKYIHSRAWKYFKSEEWTYYKSLQKDKDKKEKDKKNKDKKDMYIIKITEDLFSAGWAGFVDALKNFDESKGGFLTYATYYIDGEIEKQRRFWKNTHGITYTNEKETPFVENTDIKEMITSEEKMPADRSVLQILEVLRMLTDEDHSLSKEDLIQLLGVYRAAKHHNGYKEDNRTIASDLKHLLMEMNPPEYSDDNKDKYRILYEGYKEGALDKKKASSLTGLSYVHTFSNSELDALIQIVAYSDLLSLDEKTLLIRKLKSTASNYYETPFLDYSEKLRLKTSLCSPSRRNGIHNESLSNNLKVLQTAINELSQVSFWFGDCDKTNADNKHSLSPYQIVLYHDNYYCIGLKNDDDRIWHYRVDLMSDVEIQKDENGKAVCAKVSDFEGLPIANANWNPGKYMAEHLYMGYDEPGTIKIKIKKDDYTIIRDWFGDYYKTVLDVSEEGCDIVAVKTSKAMIVHWAMQYAGRVEIMDEDVREMIREEIAKIARKYNINDKKGDNH